MLLMSPSYLKLHCHGRSLQRVQCSFSTLQHLKTYLRCTIGEDRLSGLALMAIEQEATSKLMQTEGLDRLVEKFLASAGRRMMLY
ncbi:hypothetical protein PR048_026095 [Dryococelus australis]|uniref:Uncharacterized protein n=1 Tax=Dryococelus australis TaxID=614101 RepID=A0ABQ9GKF7_9NEOP|nr:hypothetical protein PR048_026095 [Dryococelus australis]